MSGLIPSLTRPIRFGLGRFIQSKIRDVVEKNDTNTVLNTRPSYFPYYSYDDAKKLLGPYVVCTWGVKKNTEKERGKLLRYMQKEWCRNSPMVQLVMQSTTKRLTT